MPPAKLDPKLQAMSRRFVNVVRLVAASAVEPDDALMVVNDSNLTIPQVIALQLLKLSGPHSVCEIAEHTCLSRPATSHLVSRLVDRKLVDRTEDPRDRRQKRVSLSTKGAAIIDRIFEARQAHFALGLKALSPGTRTRLNAVLEEVQRELEPAVQTRQADTEGSR